MSGGVDRIENSRCRIRPREAAWALPPRAAAGLRTRIWLGLSTAGHLDRPGARLIELEFSFESLVKWRPRYD